MSDSAMMRLQRWFFSHCDGDWEHDDGIEVATLDNPGWFLKVSIAGTELEGRVVDWVRADRSDVDWVFYRSTGTVFEAACGPLNLEEAVEYFLDFAR